MNKLICDLMNWQGEYLASSANAFPDAEIYHDPRKQQTEGKLPIEAAYLFDTIG